MAELMAGDIEAADIEAADIEAADTGRVEEAKERHIARAVGDLTVEFPDVPYDVILGMLRAASERYDTAKVRTYLPILITKDVRALLRNGGHLPVLPAQSRPVSLATPRLELAAGGQV